jgi:predicted nucleotide-binding protein
LTTYTSFWFQHGFRSQADRLAPVRRLATRSEVDEKDKEHRQVLPSSDEERTARGDSMPNTRKEGSVFIIHGHDEVNLLRLERLLKNEWSLDSIILKERPGSGRTLIEKFEAEAGKAGFAFALLTPDDIVATENREQAQPRPNVVFELGWFYGKLGRAQVCILLKAGTKLHSDLDGINKIDFSSSVEEKAIYIKKELVAAHLLYANS